MVGYSRVGKRVSDRPSISINIESHLKDVMFK